MIVVRGAARINDGPRPRSTRRSSSTCDPQTTGSIAALELGEDDDTVPVDEPDPLIDAAVQAIHAELADDACRAPSPPASMTAP